MTGIELLNNIDSLLIEADAKAEATKDKRLELSDKLKTRATKN